MPVSANTLFHFTKFESLKAILASKQFWPQYSLERFHGALPRKSIYIKTYIPMVCFCDLKLTQLSDTTISQHTNYFGKYGIGFKKEWAIKRKISPVLYIHNESIASKNVLNIINSINSNAGIFSSDLTANLGEVVKFLKPYEGYYQKNKRKSKPINYYDEREWRYIPEEAKFEAFPNSRITQSKISSYNKSLKNFGLKFSDEDIKYLIIEKEIQKEELAKTIRKSFPKKNKIQIDLISKIITLDEIMEDF